MARRSIAVLRPEPGNRVTAAAVEARGRVAIRLPLFEVQALAWTAPPAAMFDALLVTSANTIRHGGHELDTLLRLPVYAVGDASAQAAERAGFRIVFTGTGDARHLIAAVEAQGVRQAIHLGARERERFGPPVAASIDVYASDPVPISPEEAAQLKDSVAMVHSPRAGARLSGLVDAAGLDRASIAIAAISQAAVEGAGEGWRAVTIAALPRGAALIDAAVALAD
ncbi:uroporphyrinogen-III synthase [Sphingomonas sp. LB-2]|uniref:uroporphyrinogen-III synthase n=1 Tax=Sphingomonas caeni TaxID=2984949 RepID=UPI002231ADC1|nr:uroporphyrinogen-III synthase [Sphingomonas caeni]MCW3846764.1 uroporphyrinogen-III synthase [Sphingomonas caeni]